MNKTEKQATLKILACYERRAASSGGSDFELDNTPENHALVNRANAWMQKCPIAKWKKSPNYIPVDVVDGKIVTNNAVIAAYLRSRMAGKSK